MERMLGEVEPVDWRRRVMEEVRGLQAPVQLIIPLSFYGATASFNARTNRIPYNPAALQDT